MDHDLSLDVAQADAVPAPAALDPAGVDALVEALRTARLTVLIGAAGSGKSRLLQDAVRPLLRRRADDACARPAPPAEPAGSGGVDLLERRRRRACARELVVWCDRWDGSPGERLHRCLNEALGAATDDAGPARPSVAARAEALGAERGARLLFVLDHGDRWVGGTGAAAEYDALVSELCRVGPSVHVLVSARDDELPPSVRARLDQHDTRVLRLPDRRRADARAAAPPVVAAWAPPPTEADDRPLQRDEVYESIMARLAVIGDGEREAPWGGASAVAPEAAAAAAAHPATLPMDPPRSVPLRRKTASAGWAPGRPLSRASLVGVALLATMAVAVLRWQDRPPSSIPRPEPSDRPWAAVRSSALPDVPVAVRPDVPAAATDPRAVVASADAPRADAPAGPAGTEPGSDAGIAAQLWRAMADQGGPDPGDVTEQVRAGFAGRRLAIVPYDELRTLAAAPATAKTVRVVAPLYTEEVQVLARADSPLVAIHDIGGRRINVGPAQSRRGATATAVYRQLFDAPLAPGKTSTAGLGQALAELLDARSIDAIVLTEPQPSAWLAALPDAQRRRLKFLRLAPEAPSTRRALRAYLPATLRTPVDGSPREVPTLGVMSFLVANTAVTTAGREPVAVGAAQALCQALPGLRRDGHPAWRQVDPALRLPLPLRTDEQAAAVLDNCDANRSAAAFRPSLSVSQAGNHPQGEPE